MEDNTINGSSTDSAAIDGVESVTRPTKSLEQRCIELMEEKIARLEAEISSLKENKRDSKSQEVDELESGADKKDEDKDEGSATKQKEENEGEEKKSNTAAEEPEEDAGKKPKKRSRVRYIERKSDGFGEYIDKDVDDFGESEEDGDDKNVAANGKDDEYAITWRRTPSTVAGKEGTRELLIQSRALRKALGDVLKDYPLSFDTEEVVIDAPYEVIYHNAKKLEEYADDKEEAIKTDITLLLKEVEQVQASKRKDAETLAQTGHVTYELLWTVFYVGRMVCQKHMNEEQVSIIAPAYSSPTAENHPLVLWSLDYDGTNFTYTEKKISIKTFKGSKSITDLEVYPLDNWKGQDDCKTPNDLIARLKKRGEAFEKMCNAKPEQRFRSYGGIVLNVGSVEMLADSIGDDGSSDAASVAGTYGPKTQEETNRLDKLEKKSSVMIDHFAYLKYGKMPLRLGKDDVSHTVCNCTSCTRLRNSSIGELPSGKRRGTLSETQRLLCPPRFLGFAVRQKMWVQLLVENVKEISQKDKDEAFNKLELAQSSKDLLKKLVTEHAKTDNPIDDLVPGKGNGLVVLLHGPPGVGKTLTAESLAMLSNKPLYSVSMSDVGTSPITVERNFSRIFELATHWKALLLFDEADVFLQARTLEDLRRNSLVSVLIRILEYFQGILFLTSNRVKIFDEAFQSRIHVAIRYKDLSGEQRAGIWKLWLDKVKEDVEDMDKIVEELEDGGELYKAELNGRQIRNAFRSAMTLAKGETGEKKLKWKTLRKVVSSTVEFQQYMVQNEELAKRQGIR